MLLAVHVVGGGIGREDGWMTEEGREGGGKEMSKSGGEDMWTFLGEGGK